jgi:hypothetical protein
VTYSSKQLTFLAVAIWATGQIGFMAGFVMFSVARLDKATALQCKAHDWPVKAHQVHMDWCKANNYATK